MRDKCSNCYFGDNCYHKGGCDDYAPIKAKDDTDKLIKQGWLEFIDEWYEYINEYSD